MCMFAHTQSLYTFIFLCCALPLGVRYQCFCESKNAEFYQETPYLLHTRFTRLYSSVIDANGSSACFRRHRKSFSSLEACNCFTDMSSLFKILFHVAMDKSVHGINTIDG